MQLLGNKKTGLPGGTPGDPGNIRPYEFHPNQTAGTGTYPSPYATASYDAAGNPVLDTRERNYFDQQYTAMTPYSARSGTVNPNTPIAAAGGGLMAAGGPVEQMSRNVMGGQGNMFPQSQQEHTYFATPTQMPASAEVIRSDYDAKTNPYTGVMMANGGRVKGYAMGGSALGGIGQLSAGGFSPFSNINQDDLRVTSGGYNEQGKPVDGLGNPIDYSAARSQPFGQTMQGLSSMFPGAARTTPLPDSMQARDAQYRTAEEEAMMKQQSTGQSTYPSATDPTQGAFGRGAQGYPSFSGGFGNGGSGGGSGGPFPLEGQYGIIKMANGGIARYADKGMVDEEEELRKIVKRNLQKLSPEQMQSVMGAVDEQQFLRKNMPNYAEAMRPSISSMVEGAQYGDRMAQSYGGQPRDVNVMPRVQDERNYGGIASIGQQIDPNTRMNFMADLQRTPYDRNALESVRRVGAGIDRKIGKDANLSAYYEQDPMGRNKASGLRYTQNFAMGGAADLGDYSDGGRLLRGPGDGVSDDIPATIAGKQPARLADGEFVIPARIVSEIGNGSTDAGAKRLYAMMDRIQAGRKKTIGKKNVAKDTKAKKHLLA
jgi:hypothetical protein